jgi:3-methylcrotonyl-CoA carboxylase alpha subunit
VDDAECLVRVHVEGSSFIVESGDRKISATVQKHDGALAITLDGARVTVGVVPLGEERYVFSSVDMARLRLVDPLAHAADDAVAGDGHLMAPMSGSIVAVLVKVGDAVTRGAPLLILEAMKMEHTIAAPAAGTVTAIHFRQGDQVREGVVLIDIAAALPPAA